MNNKIFENILANVVMYEYFSKGIYENHEYMVSDENVKELIDNLDNISEDDFLKYQFMIELILDKLKKNDNVSKYLELPRTIHVERFREYDAVIFYIIKRRFNILRIIESRWTGSTEIYHGDFISSINDAVRLFTSWDENEMMNNTIYGFTIRLLSRSIDSVMYKTQLYDSSGDILINTGDIPSPHFDSFLLTYFSDEYNGNGLSIESRILWVIYYKLFNECSHQPYYVISLCLAGNAYPYITKYGQEIINRFSEIINEIKDK